VSEKIFPPFQYLGAFPEYNVAPVNAAPIKKRSPNLMDTVVMKPSRAEVAEEIEARETQRFIEETPDYYPSAHNAAIMSTWLSLYGVPSLCWNLTIAFKDLKQDGLLELAPRPEPVEIDKYAGVTLSRGDALAEYVPSDEETEQLAKIADDANLNDHQRKVRLKKLALLAGQQRREFSKTV
jgi:hypothetical protein